LKESYLKFSDFSVKHLYVRIFPPAKCRRVRRVTIHAKNEAAGLHRPPTITMWFAFTDLA